MIARLAPASRYFVFAPVHCFAHELCSVPIQMPYLQFITNLFYFILLDFLLLLLFVWTLPCVFFFFFLLLLLHTPSFRLVLSICNSVWLDFIYIYKLSLFFALLLDVQFASAKNILPETWSWNLKFNKKRIVIRKRQTKSYLFPFIFLYTVFVLFLSRRRRMFLYSVYIILLIIYLFAFRRASL